ncbi:hypothetical protein IFM89_016862 [Coptis chinensis]|uniref:Uncharacterized protein n=1 Tax=Coptis chinensis TaxID=261450 RepID=A0A835GWV6_9MAGN|nr:hypothetical protein IFM89_016862 [Coptis chinensis]
MWFEVGLIGRSANIEFNRNHSKIGNIMAPKKWISEAVSAMKAIGIPEEDVTPVLKKLLKEYKTHWKLVEVENYRVLADAIFEDQENKEERVKKKKEAPVHDESSQPPLTRLRMKKPTEHISPSGVTSSPNIKKGRGARTATSSSLVCFKELEVEPLANDFPQFEVPIATIDPSNPVLTIKEGILALCHSSSLSYPRMICTACLHVMLQPILLSVQSYILCIVEESLVDFCSLPRKELQALCKKNKIPANWTNKAMADALTDLTKKEGQKNKEATLQDESSGPPLKRMCLGKQEDHASPSGVTSIRKQRTRRHTSTRLSFGLCFGEQEVGICCVPKGKMPNTEQNYDMIEPRSEGFTDDFAQHEVPIATMHARNPVLTSNEECLTGECLNLHSSNKVISPEVSIMLLLNGPDIHPNQNSSQTVEHMGPLHDVSDISNREESVPISMVNEVSSEPYRPAFKYIPCNIVYRHANANATLAQIGGEDCCSKCYGDCLSSSIPCACSRKTGGEFAYTLEGLIKEQFLDECISISRNPDQHQRYCKICPLERFKEGSETCKGHLVRKFIKECWSKCGCSKGCGNRVVQRGIARNLQVFLTSEGKGWGLRTLKDLPKGTFVCEYVGEILTNNDLWDRILRRTGNEKHTYTVLLDANWGSKGVLKDEEALCLDATYYGNVARFINHRCFDANLVDIPVEVEIPDHHYYHLAFFTTRQINALEELTWDYGIDFDNDYHSMKAFQCRCGSGCCRDMKRSHNCHTYYHHQGIPAAEFNDFVNKTVTQFTVPSDTPVLDLEFCSNTLRTIHLCPCLATSKQLTVLKLKMRKGSHGYGSPIAIFSLPESLSLPRLKTLHLQMLRFQGTDFVHNLFSSCPVLEILTIIKCELHKTDNVIFSAVQLKHLEIDELSAYCDMESNKKCKITVSATNLRTFVCRADISNEYSLQNLSSLVKADIDMRFPFSNEFEELELSRFRNQGFGKEMMLILGGLGNAESLTVSALLLEVCFLSFNNAQNATFLLNICSALV